MQAAATLAAMSSSTELVSYAAPDVHVHEFAKTQQMSVDAMHALAKRTKIPRVSEWPYVVDALLPSAKFTIDDPTRIDWVHAALVLTKWIKPCFGPYVNLVKDDKTGQILDICGGTFTGHGTHAVQFMSSSDADALPLVCVVIVHQAPRTTPRRAAAFKFGLRVHDTTVMYTCDTDVAAPVEWSLPVLSSPVMAALWLLKDILNDATSVFNGAGFPCALTFEQDAPVACRQIDAFSKNMFALMTKKAKTPAAHAPPADAAPLSVAPMPSIFQRVARVAALPYPASAFTSVPPAMFMHAPTPIRATGTSGLFAIRDVTQPRAVGDAGMNDNLDSDGPVLFAPDDAPAAKLDTLALHSTP